jgi:predicted ArsR family transcriptional regulator
MVATNTRTQVRKVVGQGRFTARDFADATNIGANAARNRLSKLVEEGVVELLNETQPIMAPDGTVTRGRPRRVYRVKK